MIGEGLVDMFFGLLNSLFSGFEFINLPLELTQTISNFTAYGVWVIGLDMMVLIVSSVIFWWGIHLSIGLAVWVWNKLPLT